MSAVASFRVWRALITKEFRLVTAGRGFMLQQLVFLIVVGLLVGYSIGLELQKQDPNWTALATRAVPEYFMLSFWLLLFVLPALTVGALQEEKERGMLEVLATTPVTVRRIFGALIGARVALIFLVFLVAIPIVALPAAQGGSIPWPAVARGGVAIGLGVTLATLAALRWVALGHRTAEVWTRLVVFVLLTPFAWGRGVFAKLFLVGAALVVGSMFYQGGPDPLGFDPFLWVLQITVYPFPLLASTIADDLELLQLGSLWLAAATAVVLSYRAALGETEGWVRRQLVPPKRRQPRARRIWNKKGRQKSMARLEQAHSGEVPLDADAEGWLLARRVLNSVGPVQKFFLRRSGRSPFLVRHFLVRRNTGVIAWAAAILAAFFLLYSLPFPRNPGAHMRWMTWLLTCAAAVIVPLVGAALFPTRRGRLDDPLLATPLTAARTTYGAIWLFLFATWPLLLSAVVCVSALLPFRPEHIDDAAVYLLAYVARLTVIMGVVLWVARLWHQWAQRFGVSIAILGLLGLVWRQVVGPLRVSLQQEVALSLVVLGVGIALLCAFRFSYDRVTRRA